MIKAVGLGVEAGDLTKKGKAAILGAKRVLVRSSYTVSYANLADLGVTHVCLDEACKGCRSFDSLNKKLAKEVKRCAAEAAAEGGYAVYCVDGAATEDNSVKLLLSAKRGGRVEIIDGVSKIGALVRTVGFKDCSYTAVSAYEQERLTEGVSAPLVVYDMDDRALAGDVKLLLGDLFGDETEVLYLQGGVARKIPLYELDRQERYDYTSAVAVERTDLLEKKRFSFADLKELVIRLRRPGGCPWDRAQTPQSIKMNAVEEAYELLDAIDLNDSDKILEETGDILLQAVFHAVMQEERGEFNTTDVTTAECEKLIGRHTHIFGKDKAEGEEGALSVWDKNKMKEKHQDTFSAAVNDVPECFPALLRAQKIVKRLEKGGWTFASFDRVKIALAEDLSALERAVAAGDKPLIKTKLGDALMDMAWLGRAVGADCEEALLDAAKAAQRKYTVYEGAVLADGKDVNKLTEKERGTYRVLSEREYASAQRTETVDRVEQNGETR